MHSLFRQFSKRSLCSLLFLAAILLPSAARAAWKGSVTGSSVNIRSAPSTSAARLTQLQKGDAVTVLTTQGAWHQITAASVQGWIHADYVTASTLRTGMRGNAVRQLQNQLIDLGWLAAGQADGIFGSKTETAVRQYQAASGLASDGLAGTKTRTALQKESDLCAGIAAEAQKYLGIPYLLGGSNPQEGFDCSGPVQYVYRKFGIELPRVSSDQAAQGRLVPLSRIRPGDLVAFYTPVSHVGIALGNGKFIHSPKPGDSVKITELSYMPINAVRRLTGAVP